MITARYHYKHQHDMEMKCADVFLTREAFGRWFEKYDEQIKNLHTIPKDTGL